MIITAYVFTDVDHFFYHRQQIFKTVDKNLAFPNSRSENHFPKEYIFFLRMAFSQGRLY